ncbi:MAG: endopeptidase La [Neisseriales bacterium]|nr:MAG: endopeptidase La [Neisseriales bacterium]
MTDKISDNTIVASTKEITLPLLPLRNVVVFPYMVIPLLIGRARSVKALEAAMGADKKILLVAQRTTSQEDPTPSELYSIGVIATILQLLKLPDGTAKVLVEGHCRAKIDVLYEEDYWHAKVTELVTSDAENKEVEPMRRALLNQFEQLVRLNKKIPPEIINSLEDIESANALVDAIAAQLPIKVEQKQEILETLSLEKQFESLFRHMESEIDILQAERRIRGRVKKQMEKSQREYYLNEQVKAIQKELGENDELSDFEQIEKQIQTSGMSKEAQTKALSEFKKLRSMSPLSAEASVVRNYLDTLLSLPWKKKTKISQDIRDAEKILEEDHYGLEKVKERILEYLAVQRRTNHLKAPILCLVGPPGVGKTSLGQSIARATNRKFTRMALGGVRDEAEIRGHRRTYIGSMPGKILQNIIKSGVKNPLFLFDEVDKMGMDSYRGDPASALLEVLDPEQNHTFIDHYIEVEYDLSDVMFVATANSLNIPSALLDRMEIIRLAGYTEEEKINIAMKYLIPKQMEANGVKKDELLIQKNTIRDIIRYYAQEAGVRNLDREIAKICRKTVTHQQLHQRSWYHKVITSKNLDKFLGVHRFDFGIAETDNRVGLVTGLAWTKTGGELLTIESTAMPGKGQIIRTGQLGEVMQESISAAMSVVRSRVKQLGIQSDFYEKTDMHIHVPEGATPKDGPSAGIAMAVAIASTLTNIPVRADVAMTGEITLRGEILPIGGLKEKLLAALRGGIKYVLIPQGNMKNLAETPKNIQEKLIIKPVKWVDEVFALSLERLPETLSDKINDLILPASIVVAEPSVSSAELAH